ARLDRLRGGPRPEQKHQAQAELGAAQAEQKHAEADFARAERVVSQGAMPRAEYDTALATRDRGRYREMAAEATLDQLLHSSSPEEAAEAQAKLDGVQARYELLRRGVRSEDRAAAEAAVALAQAQLAEAEAVLRETVVTALERCVVVEVSVRPGSVVG